jgi:RNA ligase
MLLSREAFRKLVFERDHGRCVRCGGPAVDAHHILERRLFPEGGYYLDNGASVCTRDHLLAERTLLSCEELRERCGITTVVLPPQLDTGERYDKWGNLWLADGTRSPGELFWDLSVQRILRAGGVLDQFRSWVKHPRMPHLPWSPGVGPDDLHVAGLGGLTGGQVVVTEKLDGENTTMYRDHIHARSVDSRSHPTRDWVKGLWARVAADIPAGWRVCGENLWAVHSIRYGELPSFFLVFGVWDERNRCLGWDETAEWAALLGLQVVPVLYRGPFDQAAIQRCWDPSRADQQEGYVVRTAGGFAYAEFRLRVAKFVRPSHVRTTAHWLHGRPVGRNQLAEAHRFERQHQSG